MRVIHRLGTELLKIMRSRIWRASIATAGAAIATTGLALPAGAGGLATAAALPVPVPTFSDSHFFTDSLTPPSQANCQSVGRRCFTPTSMQASYNLGALYAAGHEGQGVTVAIIDSFGNPNMASDLGNFNSQMGLPHMCGEPGATCTSGMPTFTHVFWDGNTQVKAPPPNSQGTGLQDRNAWALETALDVEWVHSIAPKANILNVTTDVAETLGVQGFPAMMKAEKFVIDHHQATVISQSFASAEEAFPSTQSLLNLRDAFTGIRCVDSARPTDPAVYADAYRQIRQLAPFMAYGQFTGFAPRDVCAMWPVPPTSSPHPASSPGPGKVAVVSTTHDPATPYEAGVDLANQMGAPLITFDGTQHTVVFNGNQCVDTAVVNFLVESVVPPDGLRC